MGDLAGERSSPHSLLRTLRWSSLVLGFCNAIIILSGAVIMVSLPHGCSGAEVLALTVVSLVAASRITYMVMAGKAQRATAETIVGNVLRSSIDVDALIRHERRMRYKRWLWWTRFGMMITALQFVVALYLICVFAKEFSSGDDGNNNCLKGLNNRGWKKILTVSFLVLVWFVVIIQCSTGSDVLRWRSFYATHDTAWKAHYREVFDHGIREVLCCLGRVKYLSVLEEDEIYSVARLLGDLVTYRASGTGHLELLAGLALLQKHKQSAVYANMAEAPDVHLQEAAVFHKFAEAAYTGPLLDFGRNPILFPCAWLYRQGVLSPWARNRRPTLEGDNWWRGHAAALLKYVSLPPEALRRGRVSQTRRQAAYFVIVKHDLKSVVIAVRGTETPEDLITDGLCRDCALSMDDLDGIINSNQIPQTIKEGVISSFPHYGHSGIVEYARELFMQLDGQPADKDGMQSNKSGFLSSLMGIGCECYGYRICIVGHSLGGAVAALLGLRLFARYPNLHVYSYGALPCVDLVVAEACSDFVTCIVYNDEFSSRLSINSILRLRAAAVGAISNDSSTNPAMVTKIVQSILHTKKIQGDKKDCNALSPSPEQGIETTEDGPQTFAAGSRQPDQQLYRDQAYLFDMTSSKSPQGDFNAFSHSQRSGTEPFEKTNYLFHIDDGKSAFVDNTLHSIQDLGEKSTEVYVAGLIIHIIFVRRSTSTTWKKWIVNDSEYEYKAFVTNRKNFMDIVVSPYMFLDHLPWRCHYAIQKTLESRKHSGKIAENVFNQEDTV